MGLSESRKRRREEKKALYSEKLRQQENLLRKKQFKLLVLIVVIGIIVIMGIVFAVMPKNYVDYGKYMYLDSEIESENPLVIIEEYSDFYCPHCSLAQATIEEIRKYYGSKININFNPYPLSMKSILPAEAAECARDQNKFWAYQSLLFDNQPYLDKKSLRSYARGIRMNMSRFDSCLDNHEKSNLVQASINSGNAKGIEGTPTFFIGDEVIYGSQSFEKFKEIIDAQLQR